MFVNGGFVGSKQSWMDASEILMPDGASSDAATLDWTLTIVVAGVTAGGAPNATNHRQCKADAGLFCYCFE